MVATEVTLADLRPGDLQFGPIGGVVPGWFPVAVGQFLLADRKARLSWKLWRRIRHVGVVVQAAPKPFAPEQLPPTTIWSFRGGPRLVQAMPNGAEEIELTAARHWTPDYIYLRPAYEYIKGDPRFNHVQAQGVAYAAQRYLGTPYNFLTYGALAARRLRFVLGDWLLRRWISTRRDMMCSQLVDQALADAGYHVFNDGRLPQDVVPAELFRALMKQPGQWLRPGVHDGPGLMWLDTEMFWPEGMR